MSDKLIEKRVDLGYSNIFYLEGGITSSSTTVLFIHGWSVSVEPYKEALNILSERYHVIAPYLPGLGKTPDLDFVRNYNDYAKVITDFIKTLKLGKVHVVGHSLGGAIAIAIAALAPSLVQSLVVVDSTGIPIGSVPEVLLRRTIEMPAQMGQMKIPQVTAIFQCLISNTLFNFQTVAKTAFLCLNEDIRPILPRIVSPCLVLWGSNDLLTPVTQGQEIAKNIKGSQFIVMDGLYHEWNLFFADKFIDIVSKFIQEIEIIVEKDTTPV